MTARTNAKDSHASSAPAIPPNVLAQAAAIVARGLRRSSTSRAERTDEPGAKFAHYSTKDEARTN